MLPDKATAEEGGSNEVQGSRAHFRRKFLGLVSRMVSAQRQVAPVPTPAIGDDVMTRVKTTARGATVFVLLPSDQMFLVRAPQTGNSLSRQRVSGPRSFLVLGAAPFPRK